MPNLALCRFSSKNKKLYTYRVPDDMIKLVTPDQFVLVRARGEFAVVYVDTVQINADEPVFKTSPVLHVLTEPWHRDLSRQLGYDFPELFDDTQEMSEAKTDPPRKPMPVSGPDDVTPF